MVTMHAEWKFRAETTIRLQGCTPWSVCKSKNTMSNMLLFCRVSATPSLLNRSRDLIGQHYSGHSSYQPTSMVIVTWDSVGHYNSSTNLTNTFQAVLVTNGINSFVIFHYSELQWVESTPRNMPNDIPRYAYDMHEGWFLILPMQSNSRVCHQ